MIFESALNDYHVSTKDTVFQYTKNMVFIIDSVDSKIITKHQILSLQILKKKKKDCCIMILYVLIRKPVTSSKFISLAVQSNPRHLLNNSVQTVSFK